MVELYLHSHICLHGIVLNLLRTWKTLPLLLSNQEVITNYFRFLENKLATHNFRFTMVGNFNNPGLTIITVSLFLIAIITLI
jgi:hypothetical protein